MLREVLAVLLATALVVAAMPAVEAARERNAAGRAEASLTRVQEVATRLAATEEASPGGAARRTLSLSVPTGGFASSSVAYLAVGGLPDCETPRDTAGTDVIAYRLAGGPVRVASVPIDLRVVADGTLLADAEPLVVRGDARLTLALVAGDDGPTVVAGRGPGAVDGLDQGGRRA